MASQQYDHRIATKVRATDEWLDARINRPLAGHIVRVLLPTRVTPNQVTLVNGIFGVGAAALIARGPGLIGALGGVFLLLMLVIDCADGQLARSRGTASASGRMWDGFTDWLVSTSVHIALWAFFYRNGFVLFGTEVSSLGGTFLIASLAAWSMALHSMVFDLHKNQYLVMTGEGSSELDDPKAVWERFRTAKRLRVRVGHLLYWVYCRTQHGLAATPSLTSAQRLTTAQLDRRRATLGRHMRMLNAVGPTLHLTILGVSALLLPLFPWALELYVGFALVGANVFWAFSAVRYKRLQAQLQ